MSELSKVLSAAEAKLAAGDALEAFRIIRPLLEYPASALHEAGDLSAALGVFARIAGAIAGPDLASVLKKAAKKPRAVKWLGRAGNALYEQSLFGIAATMLARANQRSPGGCRCGGRAFGFTRTPHVVSGSGAHR